MTKISNQYSLTNILTADLANSRLGINNVSPTVALDVTGAGKFSGALSGTTASFSSNVTAIDYINVKKDGSDTAFSGAYLSVSNAANNVSWGWQLGASNKLSLWLYNGGTTSNPLIITTVGNIVINTSGTSAPNSGQLVNKQRSDTTTPYLNGIVNMASATSAYLNIYYDNSVHNISATYYTGGDGGAYKPIAFQTSDVERMRITSAGNVGIGTTSPNGPLSVQANTGNTAIRLIGTSSASSNNAGIYWYDSNDSTFNGYLGNFSGSFDIYNQRSTPMVFSTAATERMRITSGGNVGIGTSVPDQILSVRKTSAGAETIALALQNIGGTTGTAVSMTFCPHENSSTPEPLAKITAYRVAASNAPTDIIFYSYNAGMNERMRMSYTGGIGAAGSSTNIYNPSDVRLKQNISTITYGLDKIKALNPVKYNWIDGFETLESDMPLLGFIAQEVQQVIPEAVESFGGNSITIGDTTIDNPLRVNEKFIIPVLVKAIQELSAENTSLINRIEALENK